MAILRKPQTKAVDPQSGFIDFPNRADQAEKDGKIIDVMDNEGNSLQIQLTHFPNQTSDKRFAILMQQGKEKSGILLSLGQTIEISDWLRRQALTSVAEGVKVDLETIQE